MSKTVAEIVLDVRIGRTGRNKTKFLGLVASYTL